MSDFSVEEDRKLPVYGRTDYDARMIKINPRKGDVVNTIIHEKLHADYPDMPHDEVYRRAGEIESKMNLKQMGDLLHETAKKAEGGIYGRMTHTTASKVIKSNHA